MSRERRIQPWGVIGWGRYVPHEWDEWYKEARNKQIAASKMECQTGKGEWVQLPTRRFTYWAWSDRWLTQDCAECPLFVPDQTAQPILETVKKDLSPIRRYGGTIRGVCTFSQIDRGVIIPKVLVHKLTSKMRSCSSGQAERFKRAEDRRIAGRLVKRED